jgi:hypothetical protein
LHTWAPRLQYTSSSVTRPPSTLRHCRPSPLRTHCSSINTTMAPNVPSFVKPFLPSRAQIALALTILRSKPAGIRVRGRNIARYCFLQLKLSDYVLRLRAQVKRGQNPIEQDDPGHYVDLVAYWKEQCQQAQEECNRLRTINTKLERSNQLLSSQSGTTPDHDASAPAAKRKAPPAASVRSAKKPRATPQSQAQKSVAAAQDTIENDLDFLEVLGDGQ